VVCVSHIHSLKGICLVRNLTGVIENCHLRKARAVVKRTIPDALNRLRNLDIDKIAAAIKREIADACRAARNLNQANGCAIRIPRRIVKIPAVHCPEDTISSTATIYGYTGSTAAAYAEKYERTFVSIGETCGKKLIFRYHQSDNPDS